MKPLRRKRCKECNVFALLNKEEKCGACASEENEEQSCDRCGSEVEDSQDGVCCEGCRGWFHTKCEGVSVDKYEELQENEEEPWWCRKCIMLAMKHLETSKRLREEKEEWKQEQERYDSEVKELRDCLGALERENLSLKEEINRLHLENRRAEVHSATVATQVDLTEAGGQATQVDHTEAGGQNTAHEEQPSGNHHVAEQPRQQVLEEVATDSSQEERGQPRQESAEDTASSQQRASQGEAPEPRPQTPEEVTAGRRQESDTAGNSQGEEAAQGGAGQNRQQQAAADTWVGVGVQSWKKIAEGRRLHMKTSGRLQRRVWLFGDSLLRGVGREIHFLSRGYYRIMDRSKPGARVEDIKKIVEEHLADIGQNDLVVLEGGGNGLLSTGGQETVDAYEEMVRMIKEKVKQKPLIVCIPRRRGREASMFGEKRRWVNKTMMEKLEEWSCDGLQLWERMSWREVWSHDGVHMSHLGIVWMAWNVVEWGQCREEQA